MFVEAAAAGGAEIAGLLVNIAGRQRTILQMLLKHVTGQSEVLKKQVGSWIFKLLQV